ncbi:hypothetical protein [Candidatus Korobacter versatilis]|nr:hypothetical protein [Candidatus Koribacter versatilis]
MKTASPDEGVAQDECIGLNTCVALNTVSFAIDASPEGVRDSQHDEIAS